MSSSEIVFAALDTCCVSNHTAPNGPVDFSRVREVADGDQKFEREVLTVFVGDSSTRLNRIMEAIERADFTTTVLECHNLKGASGNIGAIALREIAETCEVAARNKDGAASRSAARDIGQELFRVHEAISNYLQMA